MSRPISLGSMGHFGAALVVVMFGTACMCAELFETNPGKLYERRTARGWQRLWDCIQAFRSDFSRSVLTLISHPGVLFHQEWRASISTLPTQVWTTVPSLQVLFSVNISNSLCLTASHNQVRTHNQHSMGRWKTCRFFLRLQYM